MLDGALTVLASGGTNLKVTISSNATKTHKSILPFSKAEEHNAKQLILQTHIIYCSMIAFKGR
jgi:hypothetical protein